MTTEWTLFLDRDGVLNRKIEDDYVKSPDALEMLEGVGEALATLRPYFRRMVVVTNQQGIGKGLMSEADLQAVHQKLRAYLQTWGVYLDAIYFAPALAAENSPLRKPQVGMATQAQKEFPDINFEKSIMIGDSFSDMQFGKKIGAKTIFISAKPPKDDILPYIDAIAESLYLAQNQILSFLKN
ncbi:D-glycero-alpha-D-manno-heptose-1,7-bisphosphate 7-phosphatase [Hugenholtzia roseola]|uniref:D-glycero-alpha-D-manno-heptose-1,7-bisphosphate 7-phosphatase n=1 Tax=Hugenholtzia roseola TaxID=1002 RepID=UPI00042761B1|nr:HAD family hydrolase [Hugenholtzia roseola]